MRAMVVARRYANPLDRGKLRALTGLGVDVTAVVPDVSGTPERARYESEGGLRIMPIKATGQPDDAESLHWSGRAIRRAIREAKPDLIQVEEEPWTVLAEKSGREAARAHIPLIGFSREPWPARLPMSAALRRRRTTERAAAMIAANSAAAQALEAALPGTAAPVIPQGGVEVPSQPIMHDREPVTIGFSGRLVPERGLDVLLRAAARIALPWRLLVSGTGPAQVELEQLAERLGVAARIHWKGAQPREERARLIDECDVLVAPHRVEGAFRERVQVPVMLAMAHGLAVVGTRTGPLPDLIADAGVLVAPDDVDELLAGLAELVADPDRRLAVGTACRRQAQESFSHDALARRTEALWRQVLSV